MKFLHKYGTRTNEIRRARRELYLRISMVIAVLLFFAGMIIISKFRPRIDEDQVPESALNVGDPFNNPKLIRLRADVEAILNQIDGGPNGMEEMQALERAISLQREVISLRGSEVAPKADLDKLEELLTMYDVDMGRFLMAQSMRLEKEADGKMENREYEEAIQALEKARNLQEEIDQQYPRSTDRNPSRLHRLNNQILSWQTKPLADEADRLKREAFSLVESGRFAEARDSIQKALEKQQELNDSFRSSRSASMARMREFEDAWKLVQVAEEASLVQTMTQEARSALSSEQYTLSIARAEEAEIIQRKIMDRFPELEVANPEILMDISRLKDTAASLPAFKELNALQESVREMLRTRNMEPFKNKVSEWTRATQAFIREFPNSEYAGNLEMEKVAYLHENREDIPGILETVYGNLLPVEGFKDKLLYRTEVPQSLFFQVTKQNPSVKKDPALPVDSVTWEETGDFLNKLSWILAHPVSLPTLEQFKAAIGSMNPEEIRATAWSSENTSREIQLVGTSKPGKNGFYDLAGNVAEWLSGEENNLTGRATAVGGSARDTSTRLATIPEESRSRTERNRFVGFRFVVDFSE
ncbi:SUMF1/EgtB/PvdO family nonheme iron enzyme [Puniceicoccales bacterium CK1056]|uniref:SUMF1/EgtB/PvdO family nonheme iron enzyme n=1 Tax=Oceanipulchritudo coccoides TaxID=2706888 RepID=A0A6B2M1S4_9BACT|nr:SUMF1/EgtB/PvdO family nonheme iron enzyme [Oceanipulchritudo coccoides]NDV62027.1 SUMF1/EgtB/PvdO family nonheme iron enzyme [Oceanipulchritudo coccoides]